MGDLMDDSIIDPDLVQLSNVWYDTFAEVVTKYNMCDKDIWEENAMICLYNTPASYGAFPNSDIIIKYNVETHLPAFITERIYRKDFTRQEWAKHKKQAKWMKKTQAFIVGGRNNITVDVGDGVTYYDITYMLEDIDEWRGKTEKS